jgi:hypothetical protein
MLLIFRGLWNDGTSVSAYRAIMLRNKSIFQISTIVCSRSISICNLLIDLSLYIVDCTLYLNSFRNTCCLKMALCGWNM